jgi:hypothetical protein
VPETAPYGKSRYVGGQIRSRGHVAIDMLRQWASPERGDIPRRQFRTTAIFDGERDPGAQAKQNVRYAAFATVPASGGPPLEGAPVPRWKALRCPAPRRQLA